MHVSKIIFKILLINLISFFSLFAEGKIKVVTSTLDMGDFVKIIGGEKVEVYSITKGEYDLHFFEPKPNQVVKMKKASMLVVGGLGVDPWITGLIDAARNPNINYGGIGFVDPSKGVKALQVPSSKISGAMGDVHPYGNPHFWFNPFNVDTALNNILNGLSRVSPNDKEYFSIRKEEYAKEVESTFEELSLKMLPYKGVKALQFHSSWDYFCDFFGIDLVGSVEPKPGLPPTPVHLKQLVQKIKDENIKLILAEPYYSKKPLDFLGRNTGVKVLRLPFYLGGIPKIKSYLDNLKYNVNQIINALE